MWRSFLLLAMVLVSCRPAIHVPTISNAVSPVRATKDLEACVLVQERFDRSLFVGVDQFTTDTWHYGIASILIKHPAGMVIIDPAFGHGIAEDLSRAGPYFSVLGGSADTKTPLEDVLKTAGIDTGEIRYALATHAHWDHVGALVDLPNARVLISKPELEQVRNYSRWIEGGVMPHHLVPAKARTAAFTFNGPPIDGFEHSYDVFGDGTIVAVPLPGHTDGSTGYLVRISGTTYFFTGDTTWTMRGIEAPAHKNPLVRIDSDVEALSNTIGMLHALHEARPDIVMVPAHDAGQFEKLPRCVK